MLYVENLIGAETVNTLPPDTINAFRDHGKIPGMTVREGLDEADTALAQLARSASTSRRSRKAPKRWRRVIRDFLRSVNGRPGKKARPRSSARNWTGWSFISPATAAASSAGSKPGKRDDFAGRIWKKDHTPWSKEPQPELTDRLGWLELPVTMEKQIGALRAFADQVKADGIKHVVVLGMGGSSLAPQVFQETFGNAAGYPALQVLDSTHPAAVKAVESRSIWRETLFLVSRSRARRPKPILIFYYFWEKLKQLKAIPAPISSRSPIPARPWRNSPRAQFSRDVQCAGRIGGRYSALTLFGLVPAALIGVDIAALIGARSADEPSVRSDGRDGNNPGLLLGAVLASSLWRNGTK